MIAGSGGAGLSRGTGGTETDRADFIRGLRSLECVPTAQQPASSLRSRPGPLSGPESSMVAPLTFFSTPTQCRAHSGRRGVGWCHHHIRGEGPHSGCGPAGATIRVVVSRLSRLLMRTGGSPALAASPESYAEIAVVVARTRRLLRSRGRQRRGAGGDVGSERGVADPARVAAGVLAPGALPNSKEKGAGADRNIRIRRGRAAESPSNLHRLGRPQTGHATAHGKRRLTVGPSQPHAGRRGQFAHLGGDGVGRRHA